MSDSVTLVRQHLESSLPPGIFWSSKGDFALLLDAIAEALADYYDNAVAVADVRNPEKSSRILDLADEFAAEYFADTTTEEIIMAVETAKTGVPEPGLGDLQNALISAGFDVQIHRNGPTATNPANFIGEAIPIMVAGNETAVAGNERAVAGETAGADVLINGSVKEIIPAVAAVANANFMVAGNEKAVAGYYETVVFEDYDYELPTDSNRWPAIYFVGGDATRADEGELIDIVFIDIDAKKKHQFESIILKYGPADGWAGLCVNYV